MINPFSEKYSSDTTDERLVDEALGGSRKSLEELVLRHQAWIYNIALRMVWSPDDAEDVTQESLIKIITRLATFQKRSRFRTWAYRIVANHVLTMRKRKAEERTVSFEEYGRDIDRAPDMDLPDPRTLPVELPLILEEIKTSCMLGMLLCLDREQRLAFILGELLGVKDTVGGEIMETSRDNFRQKLSRARRQLANFMGEKCGLVHPGNSCNCFRKTTALIRSGYVDPERLKYHEHFVKRITDAAPGKQRRFESLLDERCRTLFREQPFLEPRDFAASLREILESREVKDIFNFN